MSLPCHRCPARRYMGRAEHGVDVRAPSWARAREPASSTCETHRAQASQLGRAHLSRCHAPCRSVLRASPWCYLGRAQSGLAPTGRIGTACAGRGGFARLDWDGMAKGRDGVRLEATPKGNLLSTETRIHAMDPETMR